MNVSTILCLSALCGCARLFPETREVVLDGHGARPPMLVVTAGSNLRFANRDRQPHHIHSSDCGELSSRILYPNDAHTAEMGAGPKVCHFQDLLTPTVAGYSGTLQVRDDRKQPPMSLVP